MKSLSVVLIMLWFAASTCMGADPQDSPQLKKQVNPTYPEVLRRAGVEGEVQVKAVINEQGKVEKAEVVKASNRDFAPAAIEAIKQWEFAPALKDGQPIKTEVMIPVKFKLNKDKDKGSSAPKDQDARVLFNEVQRFLKGDAPADLKGAIAPDAYAVIGNKYEHLQGIVSDKAKQSMLVEGRDSKVEFSSIVLNDSQDAAYITMKTLPAKGKPERYHTIVLMKSSEGRWQIRGWQASTPMASSFVR